jgi:hypothetical protein
MADLWIPREPKNVEEGPNKSESEKDLLFRGTPIEQDKTELSASFYTERNPTEQAQCYDFEQCIRTKPVLVFGTERSSIVNSRRLSLNVPKDQVKLSSMSFTKSATCESGIVLVSLRTSKSDR